MTSIPLPVRKISRQGKGIEKEKLWIPRHEAFFESFMEEVRSQQGIICGAIPRALP
jgi:hypothetical protein